MSEQKQNQIQNIFFSKDTIAGINKIIIQESNLQNISREGKQEVIGLLVKNMKTVYKNLDTGKINQTNIGSILEQFKKMSLSNTINDIKKQKIALNNQISPSDLKFQRDFTSNPNKGNQFMERPEMTKQTNPSIANQQINNIDQRINNIDQRIDNIDQRRVQQQQKQQQNAQQDDMFSGFSSDVNNYDSNFDTAFRPIVDTLSDQDAFNSYDGGRNIEDINTRMSSIQQSRETELNIRAQRPSTPEFLKPKKTSLRQEDNNDIRNNSRIPTDQERHMPDNRQGQGKVPDFKNINASEFNNSFNGLANDTGDNLFSLENIDKPLIDSDMVEDTSSFEDRLKRLQSDRDNFNQVPVNNVQQDIDFTSQNFPSSNMGDNNINNYSKQQPSIQKPQPIRHGENQQQLQQQSQQQQSQQQQSQQRQLQQLQLQQQQLQQQQLQQQQLQQQQLQQQQLQQQQLQQQQLQRQSQQQQPQQQSQQQQPQQQSQQFSKLDDLKLSMRSMNIDIKEDTQKILQYKQELDQLEYENKQLKNVIENLEVELQKPNEIDKINQLKEQIANEFENLNHRNEDLESKQLNLNLKEIEINKKESDVKQMIANYDYLFKSQHLQFEVTNSENKSSYTWSMDPIKNVIGIKLMSYSLPMPRFNIEKNKNHIFTYKINENEFSVVLPTGRYSIDELIFVLNDKIKKINDTLSFSVNNEQRIIFESSNEEENIEIIPTLLSKENLGFILSASDKNKHLSDRIWDLRIDDKVYLYLNNLSDEVPFGILYFNGQSISQFKFQDPFDLNNLEINFKDSKGMMYNFYELSHSLSFLIEKIN